MKAFLSKSFYQRYFSAVRRQHADWLSVVPEQARLAILAYLTQWDIKEMSDKQYREHL
ncbi:MULTISPECIES: glucose uptake inhibitor SgrT [Serratia]|uniref:glucose uptake inhibitor SgrT n=1 Tax=Serratia TaxID=613 RepID=UPI0018A71B71|nr:glucose uptake inhibitor SgrT [Serratia ureilytica]MBF4185906.1 glucose uptake inhibitor SgrT [Serratia ureilytica]MBF8438756.1 glucose uptake inhibitor SgrT [Serratia ureilytica]MBF8443984.1 glucose uptake inhibitor SgrT [Serratia ureilytica]MBJ2095493.1 glucose uptake inhibitor SgrT [Serratia ureilytica]QWU38025.1 glucose uptake inhibitor SgrT [Serratia ureilytica]